VWILHDFDRKLQRRNKNRYRLLKWVKTQEYGKDKEGKVVEIKFWQRD